jgi:RNA polymerase sigma-70 factor (ECF subfamily)
VDPARRARIAPVTLARIRSSPTDEQSTVRADLLTASRGYDALEDAALVALLTEGDGAALEALYGRYGRPAYALARRILADESLAQDVVQEVFLAVWRDPGRFDPARGGFASWLLTLTHHKAVDSVRREENLRKRRAAADALEFAESADPQPDEEVWAVLRRDRVRSALADLPDPQREALGLAYFGGYTQREIAKLTDTPLGTVKTRMLAGMKRLRGVLQVPLDEPRGRP